MLKLGAYHVTDMPVVPVMIVKVSRSRVRTFFISGSTARNLLPLVLRDPEILLEGLKRMLRLIYLCHVISSCLSTFAVHLVMTYNNNNAGQIYQALLFHLQMGQKC